MKEFEKLNNNLKNPTNKRSAITEVGRFTLANYPVISGGRYEYTPSEGGGANEGRHDEWLDTINDTSGESFVDGQYWCDTGTWGFGPNLVSPPKPSVVTNGNLTRK